MGKRRILDRDVVALAGAPFQTRHWRALYGFLTVLTPRWEALARYLSQRGSYPWEITIKTPTGTVPVTLYSRHDLLTVNEIFCRLDYSAQAPELVVDVGANIGLATLFWLTRRPDSKVYCYEPNPRNVERLKHTLRQYEGRFEVIQAAVAKSAGMVRFTFEDSGRYGRISDSEDLGGEVIVPAVALGDELARIALVEGRQVDLVKIDTEGTEPELVASIPPPVPALVWELDGQVQRSAATSGMR